MAICDSCKRLAAASRRLEVPAHLLRLETGSAIDRYHANYRCVSCLSQWRWIAPSTWVLMLPPTSAPEDAPAWWTTLGRILAGARASRRSPIEMRAPRLEARRPSTTLRSPPPTVAPPPVDPEAPRSHDGGR